MSDFSNALRAGGLMLMDGAMGTELIAQGLDSRDGFERLNLSSPETVLAIHQAYVAAGARVLLTNTFQVGRMSRRDLADREQIIRAGVTLARQAVGAEGFVLGDLGPASFTDEELRALLPGFEGADALLVETESDFDLLDRVLRAQSNRRVVPVLFSATYQKAAGRIQTHGGMCPSEVARQAAERKITALGVNCGKDIGLDDIVQILRDYRAQTHLPLFARPNAGQPKLEGGRWVYPMTPADMGEVMPELQGMGICMMGGCCGTTPAHIAACRT